MTHEITVDGSKMADRTAEPGVAPELPHIPVDRRTVLKSLVAAGGLGVIGLIARAVGGSSSQPGVIPEETPGPRPTRRATPEATATTSPTATASPEPSPTASPTAAERAKNDPLHQTQLTEKEMTELGMKGSALFVRTELKASNGRTVPVEVIVNSTPDMLKAVRDMRGIELNPTIPGGGETPADKWLAKAILGFHWAGYLRANPTLTPESYTLDQYISDLAGGKDRKYKLMAVRDGIGTIGEMTVDPTKTTKISYYGDEGYDPFLNSGYVGTLPSGETSNFTVKVSPKTGAVHYLFKVALAISEQHKQGQDNTTFFLTTGTADSIHTYLRLSNEDQQKHLGGRRPRLPLNVPDKAQDVVFRTICPPNPETGYCWLGDSAIKVIYQTTTASAQP